MTRPVPQRSDRFRQLLAALDTLNGMPSPTPGVLPTQHPSAQLGITPSSNTPIDLTARDRRQGTYILGGTGTGKTTLLQHLIHADIRQGVGLCVLDPHGDLITDILRAIPARREADVVLLNPVDVEYPFGLNLTESVLPYDQLRFERRIDEGIGTFKKLWGTGGSEAMSWGPQLADFLGNCLIALTETDGATLAELPRLVEDAEFRHAIVARLDNLEVKRFWQRTYDPLRLADQLQLQNSTANKVRPFVKRRTIRNIIGQSTSTVDLRECMDTGKIVLVPLPGGLLGDETAQLVGSLIVGRILSAALSRQDLPPHQRRPFHLFADEYQQFATGDFARLLVEARKFGIAITMAHQYRGQLDPANRDASLNVANLIVFRVSGPDAAELASQFDNTPPPGELELKMVTTPNRDGSERPVKTVRWEFDGDRDQRVEDQVYAWQPGSPRLYSDMLAERANGLASLRPYHAQVRLRRGNQHLEAELETLPAPADGPLTPVEQARIARLIAHSRQRYARPRADVESELRARLGVEAESDEVEPPAVDSPAASAEPPSGRARRRRLE
jgi:hypothetical protein